MFFYADNIPKNSILETDICVIGSGPAGLAFALEFLNSRREICVLESGDFQKDEKTQSLYDFETTDLPISRDSRMRVFGGTGTAWMGLWKEHDPIDFEHRYWIPNSGWPISKSDLAPYYERAAKLFDAPNLDSDSGELDTDKIKSSYLVRLGDADLDLGQKYRSEFEKKGNIQIYLKANLVKLIPESNQSRLQEILVKTLKGNEFKVGAKLIVLACGGIENARLLLLSNVGNENVGRYYMDHPKGVAGRIKTYQPVKFPSYFGEKNLRAGLTLRAAVQKEQRILNSFITLEPLENSIQRFSRRFFKTVPAVQEIRVRNYLEQAPDRKNRIYLSDEKDSLGCPKPKIDWSIGSQDQQTMRVFHEVLKAELKRLGIGELESQLLSQETSKWPITTDASHHMGTTRMGKDPKNSVVDENCKVHELDNLYMAGSSVFPTGGYANPNATIVALAIRLADYLKKV